MLGIAVRAGQRRKQGCLHAAVLIDCFLDSVQILFRNDLDFLYMALRFQCRIGLFIPVRIVRFQYRAFPRKQVGHRHRILAADLLGTAEEIVQTHVIDRKLPVFFRKQRCLQRADRRKRPTGAKRPLVAHLRRTAKRAPVIGNRQTGRKRRTVRHAQRFALFIKAAVIIQAIGNHLRRNIIRIPVFYKWIGIQAFLITERDNAF